MICCVDNTTFKVSSRGISAVTDHAKSKTHKDAIEARKKQGSMGVYSLKYMSTRDAIANAEMHLVVYASCHNIPFNKIDHLVE